MNGDGTVTFTAQKLYLHCRENSLLYIDYLGKQVFEIFDTVTFTLLTFKTRPFALQVFEFYLNSYFSKTMVGFGQSQVYVLVV